MKDNIKWQAVASFLSTMDAKDGREINLLNAMHDSWLYQWGEATTQALLTAIHETYDAIKQTGDL